MAPTPKPTLLSLDTRITVPEHVVHRDFVEETVILNLETGNYHGLNPTAGFMLTTLQACSTIRDAVPVVAEEYQQPPNLIERDLLEFCDDLVARGLVIAE